MIEHIEAHSYLSTPADIDTDFDGWLIRLSHSSAKRANSVNFPTRQVSAIALDEKIGKCEEIFLAAQKSCIFRLTPLAEPSGLKQFLIDKYYVQADPTDVLIQDITAAKPAQHPPYIEITNDLNQEQLEALCSLTEKAPDKYAAFEKALMQIKIDRLFAFVRLEGKIVSAGMATFQNNLMGLFEFSTHTDYQRRGYAADIVSALIAEGQKRGATTAYLQVVQSNSFAQKFWKSQNFTHKLYDYVYLIKTFAPQS